jgi:hypothetical protein
MTGKGKSLNADIAKKELDSSGSFKVVQAKFTSIDIGKMASESINGSIQKIGDKIPQIKGKQLPKIPGRECVYDSISSDFKISDGLFSMPNFKGVAQKNNGIDLEGATQIGLLNQSLSAKWKVIDTYNYTRAHDLSVDQMGVKIDHILAEKGKPVSFPIGVKGFTHAPEYQTNDLPEHFAKVVGKNLVGGVKDKAMETAKQKVQEQIQKSPEAQKVQEQIKDKGQELLKKFKF